ncbi:MAG: hypothetical protein R3195_16695 [Gemmatimonadota bacterium]|nr:hypothetical protein [Gemmatimonadota bacterium]
MPRRTAPLCLAGLILAVTAVVGCSTRAPEQSVVQAAIGRMDVSSRRVRVGAQNGASSFMMEIELTADSIARATDDLDVSRQALAWKAHAIPAVQRAMYRSDPVISIVDGWVLLVQMSDYFETGRGRALFGREQPIAVEKLRVMQDEMDESVLRVLANPEHHAYWHDFVYEWAAANPLDNDRYLRRSVALTAADILGSERMGGMSSLGSMQELAVDAQAMAASLAEYAPKTVMWQSELLLTSMMDTTRLAPIFESVDDLETSRAAVDLMQSMPELVASERAAMLTQVERMIEVSRVASLDFIALERQAMIEEMFGLYEREREEIFSRIEIMLPAMMDQARDDAIEVIDHVLLRVAIGGAAFLGALVLIGLLFFRPRRAVT